MSHCSINNRDINGFKAVEVDNGILSFGLIPKLGGKIYSLKDLRTGREWLWRNPRQAYKPLELCDSYVTDADTGGWDECFPTISACEYPSPPWTGAVLQDHGELWSQAATLNIVEKQNQTTLRTRWKGAALDYTFERSVTLDADRARLFIDYVAVNNTFAPMHFIWCAHVLLAIEPGMQLVLPPSARFNRSLCIPEDLIAQDHEIPYPPRLSVDAESVDTTSLPDASAALAFKLWSDPLREGWATLSAPDGELRMAWDTAQISQVALWMNIGAWSGDGGKPYYNLGLEPCIGAQDSLAEAVTKHDLYASLPPYGVRSWHLEVQLTNIN